LLDVACGTGVLALAALELVGPDGAVTGLDVNDGMLDVARRKGARIDWRNGRAEALPFPDATFDRVVSQFGLMFFEDRRNAVREMVRVLKSGGRLAVAVWASLDDTPGYAAVTRLLERLFGSEAAEALRSPFALGAAGILARLTTGTGLDAVQVQTMVGTARFPSIKSWMFTDVRGWTLADLIDEEAFERLLGEAETVLNEFVRPDGTVAFASPAHILSAQKS
jgi:SAM-dependent methyltransferase